MDKVTQAMVQSKVSSYKSGLNNNDNKEESGGGGLMGLDLRFLQDNEADAKIRAKNEHKAEHAKKEEERVKLRDRIRKKYNLRARSDASNQSMNDDTTLPTNDIAAQEGVVAQGEEKEDQPKQRSFYNHLLSFFCLS